jgi:hypothetical protein
MNKEQKEFYTADFYKSTKTTLKALNTIVQSCQIGLMDMYHNGEFLYMDAHDDSHTRKALSTVISDFDAYKAYNKRKFHSASDTRIALCALVDDFEIFFGKKIVWDYANERFVLLEYVQFF